MAASFPQMLEPTQLARDFGKVLRRRRESAGLSQEALADASGIHRTHVSLLERGLREPKLSTLAAVADGLGCSMAALVRELE